MIDIKQIDVLSFFDPRDHAADDSRRRYIRISHADAVEIIIRLATGLHQNKEAMLFDVIVDE